MPTGGPSAAPPYFRERRGNSWLVGRWDLTRREQRALADMMGVRWVAGLGVDLFTPEGLSLADDLLADPAFQSCRRMAKLMLIPAEPHLITDLLERLLQAQRASVGG